MRLTADVQLTHQQGKGGDKLRVPSWIEIVLIGEDEKPIGGERYAVELPGGTIVTGRLSADGTARLDRIPPGTCKVSFPDLDKDAWTPVATQSETSSDNAAAAA